MSSTKYLLRICFETKSRAPEESSSLEHLTIEEIPNINKSI